MDKNNRQDRTKEELLTDVIRASLQMSGVMVALGSVADMSEVVSDDDIDLIWNETKNMKQRMQAEQIVLMAVGWSMNDVEAKQAEMELGLQAMVALREIKKMARMREEFIVQKGKAKAGGPKW